MEFKYMEITMCLMLGLTSDLKHVVNGSCLVEPLDCSTGRLSFAKDPLGSGSSSFEVLPQRHRPVHLSVQSTNKMKRMFEPCTRYCHIHLACKSVCYKGKIIISK